MLHPDREPIPILFSGLSATSKTNYSQQVAAELGRPWVGATAIMLELTGVYSNAQSVWATDDAVHIQSAREGDAIDRELDVRVLEHVRESPDSVVDAWAAPWLWKGEAVRVLVRADEDTRIQRCLASYPPDSQPTVTDARQLLEEKDDYSQRLFMRLYGFDLVTDHEVFDLILDTSGFEADTPDKSGSEIARERILPAARHAIEWALNPTSGVSDSLNDAIENGIVLTPQPIA